MKQNICFDCLYSVYVKNISHCKKNSARHYHKSTKALLFQSSMELEYTRKIFDNVQISFFIGAEMFHPDRQTGMRKLIIGFRNFSKAPKKGADLHFRSLF